MRCLRGLCWEPWPSDLERDGREEQMKSGWERRHPRDNGAPGHTLSFPTGHKAKSLWRPLPELTVAWGWWRGGAGTQQVAPEHRRNAAECLPSPLAWRGTHSPPASPRSQRQKGSSEGRHQPEGYLNVWLSAPPRPNPGSGRERGQHRCGMASAQRGAPRRETGTPSPLPLPPTAPATATLPLGPNKAA